MVILVERFDMQGKQQKVLYGDFMKTAVAKFGKPSPPPPHPTHSNISFGTHPHQLVDIYLPKKGEPPYPALLWFGGIWKAAKHPANLGFFEANGIAVVAVQTRTMEDATAMSEPEPIAFVQSDAVRAVQFVRSNAGRWISTRHASPREEVRKGRSRLYLSDAQRTRRSRPPPILWSALLRLSRAWRLIAASRH